MALPPFGVVRVDCLFAALLRGAWAAKLQSIALGSGADLPCYAGLIDRFIIAHPLAGNNKNVVLILAMNAFGSA